MATDPLLYAGLGLFLVSLWTITRRPELRPARRLLLVAGTLFAVSGVLLVGIARDNHRFRVTKAEVTVARSYVGPCPGRLSFRARVTTAGGAGRVAIQALTDDDLAAAERRGLSRTVSVKAAGSFDFVASVPVARAGLATAYLLIEEPGYLTRSASSEVRCTGGPTS